MPTTLRPPLAAVLTTAAMSSIALLPIGGGAHASTPAPRVARIETTNTFAFQNIGHETNGKQVMINMRNGVNARAGDNRFFDFAEIGEGQTAADAREHTELQQVFGTTRWVRFATDDPVLNQSASSWQSDGTELVTLGSGMSIAKCTPPRHLVVGTWHWATSSATKIAVINSHFPTGAYNTGPRACQLNHAKDVRIWNALWDHLRDKVTELRSKGYDVAVTADFNRHTLPQLVTGAVVTEHRGPDQILAIPSSGRRVVVKKHGDFDAGGEPTHHTIWSTVTFANK